MCIELGRQEEAIDDFNKALQLNPDDAETLVSRGWAQSCQGEHDHAVQDYSTAMELKHGWSRSYCNRALAFMHLQKWRDARSDLTTAKNLGMNIVAMSHERYPTISHLEQEIGAAVPEDIANMLRYSQSPGETSN